MRRHTEMGSEMESGLILLDDRLMRLSQIRQTNSNGMLLVNYAGGTDCLPTMPHAHATLLCPRSM